MRAGPVQTALLATMLAVGCGGAPGGPAGVPGAAEGGQDGVITGRLLVLTDRDIDGIIRDTSAARQLVPKRPVAVRRLGLRRFREHLLETNGEKGGGPDLSEDAAFMLGFDFVPEPGKRGGISSVDEVLAEQVVGYYDPNADKVFIPDVGVKGEDDLLQQRAVLAHEVQHALQAQVFPKLSKPSSADESIAHLALIEGDAQVAMGAWLGASAGAPVGRTLRRIVEVTSKVPLSSVTRGEENKNKKLEKALELTKQRLEFPYKQGMLFVSDVYRAGGFPLVDKLYANPPRSTAMILHPDKYLRGVEPRPVADPKPPPGFTLATVGTLGELDTRILLERCMAADVAERAAAGWAGDRYAVMTSADRKLATAWISAWDTEQDAAEMEDALGKSAACWHANALGLAASDYTIGAGVHVKRRGKLVAFVRGLPQGVDDATAGQLLGLVGPEPAARPITELSIPPRVRLPEQVPGRLTGDVYQNDWLGIVGRVPSGMNARTTSDMDFVVERPDVLVRGGVSISTRITTEEQNEKTFREVQDAFVVNVAKLSRRVQVLGGGPVRTALGAGVERSWRVEGTAIELRLVLLPICAGTGSIVFIQAYGDRYARSVLDGWLDSFRWIHGRNITACDFLDPK